LIVVTNEEKSIHSEVFPFPNTTPFSQLRHCGNHFFIHYKFDPT